ncbi:GDSL-type esterase/lipase family protein [Calothrix rhizosoleniae]|uniref:GDSL-type esterase/lipase family protein n=1 Tax=Calothrix rhizosoleniae TaxID=888997 RepID=UPI000B49F4A5|nr:GDSL-type esterase/lipase family protein [Calothrix rhizosoleniae]
MNQITTTTSNPSPQTEETTLDFGNTVNGGSGNQNFDGNVNEIETVDYSQATTSVDINLEAGITTYNVAPENETPLTIMPLGDSITEGYLDSDTGGCRDDLYSILTDKGYNVDFVGDRGRGDGNFDQHHAGVSGERIDQVSDRVDGLLDTYQPDIVLLMIGTNDILQNNNLEDAPNRLSSLIDQITNQSPDTQVIVSSIPPDKNSDRQELVDQYNALIPEIVESKRAAGKNVSFVDTSSSMNTEDLEDDVHPTPTGNNKIARSWYEGIRDINTADNDDNTPGDTLSNIDNIIGTSYNDVLTGNSSDNILVGEAGNDTLTGGAGIDQFAIGAANGLDTITDFQVGEDVLVLTNGLTYEEINIVSAGDFGYNSRYSLILNPNQEQLALLIGVQPDVLSSDNFITST